MTIARMIVVAATTAALLAGCAAGPPAGPRPTYTAPAAIPTTPVAAPELAVVTIYADRVVATDQNGDELATFSYTTTAPTVVAAFTGWFGFEPTTTELNRDIPGDGFAGTQYEWNGFHVSWRGGWEDEPGSGQPNPPFGAIRIHTTVSSVGSVVIQSADGTRVGDYVDIAANYPDSHRVITNYDGTLIGAAWSDCVLVEGAGVPDAVNCVSLSLEPSSGPVTAVYAPYAANWGV